MKWNNLIILLFLLLFSSCCKEEDPIIEYPSLIGSWEIIQVDSCHYNYESMVHDATFIEKGSIIFNKDSTGLFENSIRTYKCGETDFYWRHNNENDIIDFMFSNGNTIGILDKFKTDTIDMYFRDDCDDLSSISWTDYYFFRLKRKH